jgi:predicted permease
VTILSDRLWRRRFGADPGMIGRSIAVGGVEHVVVGVMPEGFEDLIAARLFDGAELWFPLGYDPAAPSSCRTCRHLRVLGRLAPGVSPAEAAREAGAVFAALQAEHARDYHRAGARVRPLGDVLLGPVRRVLLVVWAGVGALLLVACGNAAILVLLRAGERAREAAVRAALGATRGRLARQLVTETVLLAGLGLLAGLLLAHAAMRLLVVAGAPPLPRLAEVALDGRAAIVAVLLALACGVALGLVALRHLAGGRAPDALQGAGRRTDSAAAWRARSALVGANLAVSVVLLVGSGLMVRSLTGLLAVAPGFDPADVVTLKVWLGGVALPGGDDARQVAAAVRFYDEVLSRTRAVPGVTAAAAVTMLPLGGGEDSFGLHVAGRPSANPEAAPSADRFVVAPGYFAAMRIPLLRGRLLEETDAQGGAAAVVVNRTLADELFPAGDVIGSQVSLGPPTADRRTIVGVVGDVRHPGLHAPVPYQVYVPQAQWPWAESALTLVVRAPGDPAGAARAVRGIVGTLDPSQPITDVRLYEDVLAASTGTRRLAATLLTAFAGTALALALVGLYGALGVFVGQRRREIGVRLALGARAEAIRTMVMLQGMRPVLVGLAVGLGAAAVGAGALRTLLYGIATLDAATFAGASAVLLVAAAGACLVPAWRAAAIDPASALRSE